jgi:hypothetical protein
MTYEEFIEKYKPVTNHLFKDRSLDNKMFETFGEELDYILKNIFKNIVWTVIEGEDDNWYISTGYHIVNRLGYIITEIPYESEFEFLID